MIITLNEEKNLGKCIESVLRFSDEVIIVDSFSTDSTREIATQFSKVKFSQRPFDNYILQKNYANSLAGSEYIFSIDADEYTSHPLVHFLETGEYHNYDAISFRRVNFFKGHKINFGLWGRDRKVRLFKKNLAHWVEPLPHENLYIDSSARIFHSSQMIYHKAASSYEEHYEKSLVYARMAAERYDHMSAIQLLFAAIMNPILKVFRSLILYKGVLDGWYGLQLGWISGVETFYKYYFALRYHLNLK